MGDEDLVILGEERMWPIGGHFHSDWEGYSVAPWRIWHYSPLDYGPVSRKTLMTTSHEHLSVLRCERWWYCPLSR